MNEFIRVWVMALQVVLNGENFATNVTAGPYESRAACEADRPKIVVDLNPGFGKVLSTYCYDGLWEKDYIDETHVLDTYEPSD